MNRKKTVEQYFKKLAETTAAGDAREESYYAALAGFMETVAKQTGRDHVHVTTLPKKTEGGNPDFRVWDGQSRIIGYIEAKKPGQENLAHVEQTEQLRRYRDTFPNLILTDFCEFRLYKDGQFIESVMAARPAILTKIGKAPPEKPDELINLIERFFDFSMPAVTTAEELAKQLAKRTRFLRNVTADLLKEEEESPGSLTGFYEAFQQFLIGGLDKEEFADLYAQTITYGLFAARSRARNGFTRKDAFHNIPHTIGVLRDIFRYISLEDPPEQLEWIVDDIAEVLDKADAPGILDAYFHQGKGSDPIVHFYETFLAVYDPEEREKRGVYYTPEPVVSYIVRSVHEILKSDFKKPEGLADNGVTLLDPAAGTMTFIARAAELAVSEFQKNYGAGAREEFIKNHVLQNFYAFELMMAPYAVGHLKMAFFLEELGHRLKDDERMPFYLTNSLDTAEMESSKLPGFSSLAEESHKANEVKKQKPILVILGNPPYSGESSNQGPWIRGLIDDYKKLDDKPLQERALKWLQDDYVKFLRFAQWKIDQAGKGVVAMITNHSYLDNPTFRGMRQSLMNSFDEIHVLDLHGNSLKKETAPDGSPDKNVFDIRQGVAIALFVKHGKKKKDKQSVRHAELYGSRTEKYEWLESHERENTAWTKLEPMPEFHLFVPRDNGLEEKYKRFVKIPELFPKNSVGIVTARDKLTIQWTPEDVWKTVTVFSKMEPETAREGFQLGKDVRDWKVQFAQQDLLESGPSREKVLPVLYRPFDVRYTYYTGHSRGFHCMPRPEVMRHMLAGENLAMMTPRQNKYEFGSLVTDKIAAHKTVAAYDINYLFPLYLYPDPDKDAGLYTDQEPTGREANLSPGVVEALSNAYGRTPSPEEIFYYVYAVLHAPSYRDKYEDFLRMDFPRAPFTSDAGLFDEVAGFGGRLVDLHLLRSTELDPPAVTFEGEGDGKVARTKGKGFGYDAEAERVYINKTQYFGPVPAEVWEFMVGGYRVCEKWLKDRKERVLSFEEIKTYCRVVTALGRTMEIQKELDERYEGIENKLLEVEL